RRLAEPVEDDPEREAFEHPRASAEQARDEEVFRLQHRGEAVVSSFELRRDPAESAWEPADDADQPEGELPVADDGEQREDESRADAGPDESSREAERRAEDDQDDNAHDVGGALGDDDGSRARDRDAVGLEQNEGLEDFADLAGRHREDEA